MLEYLEQLCETRIPRKFTCAHAVMALRRLQNEPYLGRYILQDMLGLSEASVRSLLNLLKRHELIQVNPRRKGHRLSRRGEDFVQWMSNWIISLSEVQFHELIPEGTISIGLIVKNAGHLVTSGVDQRDDAIRRERKPVVYSVPKSRSVPPIVRSSIVSWAYLTVVPKVNRSDSLIL